MRISGPGLYALGVLAAAALLVGCTSNGGSQSAGLTPSSGTNPATSPLGAETLTRQAHQPSDTYIGVRWMGAVRPDRQKSWISPDAQRAPRLLFMSDTATDTVDAFTMPDMQFKGKLTGFNQPQGECSDTQGNVYITNTQANQVLEYSRTGALLNTYSDTYGYPVGCAVNPLNGDLAVTDIIGLTGHGQLLIYTSPSSSPTVLINPDQYNYYFVGYDIHGDLWEDGRTAKGAYILSGCGGFVCHTINLSGGTINFPGAVQWDQKEYSWVLFDQLCGGKHAACSYWVSGSGVLGNATNYVIFNGDPACDLIQGVVAAYGKQYTAGADTEGSGCANAGNSSINRWQYPAGGTPTDYLSKLVQPDGVAISTRDL